MTRIGDIGTPCIVTTREPLAFYVSLALIKPQNIDSYFLNYYIQTPYFKRELWQRTLHMAIPQKINKDEIGECRIAIPSIQDQYLISKLFIKIDSRIETQNKIIKEYETLKNWIISYEINNVVAEEVRLDSISDIYQPQTISQAELDVCGLYNVYGANGIIGKYNKFNHEKPQICLTCRGSTCGKLLMSEPKSWITGNAMVINTDKYSQVNKKYLFVFLTTINFSNIISGSGQPQIVRAPLAQIKVKLPLITIQKRIERNISILEEKLQKEKDILNAYKKQKAYLLQNMFI